MGLDPNSTQRFMIRTSILQSVCQAMTFGPSVDGDGGVEAVLI